MPFDFCKVDLGYDDLVSEDTPNGRYYTTPDGKYPSITTMLSRTGDHSWLDEWRARVGEEEAQRVGNIARNRGTDLHKAIENYLLKGDPQCPDLIIEELFQFYRRPLEKHLSTVYGLERALYSSALRIAGRADLIGVFAGYNSIIDYKTSKGQKTIQEMPDYWIQTCFYALSFQERTGIKVPQLVILIKSDFDTECLVYRQRTVDWIGPLLEKVEKYAALERS